MESDCCIEDLMMEGEVIVDGSDVFFFDDKIMMRFMVFGEQFSGDDFNVKFFGGQENGEENKVNFFDRYFFMMIFLLFVILIIRCVYIWIFYLLMWM